VRAKIVNFLKTKSGMSKDKVDQNDELLKNLAETIVQSLIQSDLLADPSSAAKAPLQDILTKYSTVLKS
jgi:hypothetical protein